MTARYELLILSYSAGQESSALLHEWRFNPEFRAAYSCNRFVVVMSDTQDEHGHTYQEVERVRGICAVEGIEFYFITESAEREGVSGYHPQSWPGLIQFYERTTTIGSKAYPKSCTDNLKVTPIYNLIEEKLYEWYPQLIGPGKAGRKQAFHRFSRWFGQGKLGVMIGIARGEEKRIKKSVTGKKWFDENVTRLFPLIDYFGWSREDCQAAIARRGEPVPYPSYCQRCPFATMPEILWLWRFKRAEYEEWVVLEAAKIDKWAALGQEPDKNIGVFPGQRLPQVLVAAQRLYGHLSDQELDALKQAGHCVASVY
ncbi:MAG: hypothetical protein ACFFD1_01005 [Candidatus Thorarchaeota archaeon]